MKQKPATNNKLVRNTIFFNTSAITMRRLHSSKHFAGDIRKLIIFINKNISNIHVNFIILRAIHSTFPNNVKGIIIN